MSLRANFTRLRSVPPNNGIQPTRLHDAFYYVALSGGLDTVLVVKLFVHTAGHTACHSSRLRKRDESAFSSLPR